MSSTHLSFHYHFVFGTKNHEPWIAKAWRPQLHAYMGGIIRSFGGVPEMVGGVADHVHILAGLRTQSIPDLMREVKSVSSRWIHEEIGLHAFAWQEGYGGFSVDGSHREGVRRYIEGRKSTTGCVRSRRSISISSKSTVSISIPGIFKPFPSPLRGWSIFMS